MGIIDKEELLANIEMDLECSVEGEENMQAVQAMMQAVYDDVKNAPEILSCGECHYFQAHKGKYAQSVYSHGVCKFHNYMPVHGSKDYCSRGYKNEWFGK